MKVTVKGNSFAGNLQGDDYICALIHPLIYLCPCLKERKASLIFLH